MCRNGATRRGAEKTREAFLGVSVPDEWNEVFVLVVQIVASSRPAGGSSAVGRATTQRLFGPLMELLMMTYMVVRVRRSRDPLLRVPSTQCSISSVSTADAAKPAEQPCHLDRHGGYI